MDSVQALFNRMLDDISREHTQTQGSQSVGVALNELLRAHEATQPLSDMAKRLIRWHITNQEYSTGADITNLSPLELSETIDFQGSHCLVQVRHPRFFVCFLVPSYLKIKHSSHNHVVRLMNQETG